MLDQHLPKQEGFPFLAFVEHTNYIDRSHYGGDNIVLLRGLSAAGPRVLPRDAGGAVAPERFIPGIQRINPDFRRDWIRAAWEFEEIYAQPVPLLNQSRPFHRSRHRFPTSMVI